MDMKPFFSQKNCGDCAVALNAKGSLTIRLLDTRGGSPYEEKRNLVTSLLGQATCP
jgi:hypothetical protein